MEKDCLAIPVKPVYPKTALLVSECAVGIFLKNVFVVEMFCGSRNYSIIFRKSLMDPKNFRENLGQQRTFHFSRRCCAPLSPLRENFLSTLFIMGKECRGKRAGKDSSQGWETKMHPTLAVHSKNSISNLSNPLFWSAAAYVLCICCIQRGGGLELPDSIWEKHTILAWDSVCFDIMYIRYFCNNLQHVLKYVHTVLPFLTAENNMENCSSFLFLAII